MILCNTIIAVCCLAQRPSDLAAPVQSGRWILPASSENALPYWGHKEGIRVAIPPSRGPRGLISIYTPYLGQNERRLLNFVALEPIVDGRRGYSEMEKSRLDDVQGLRFWTENSLNREATPRKGSDPVSGVVTKVGDHEELTFFIHSEPMHNGARPIVQVIFRSDRPHEVGFRTYSATGSADMDSLILSATMGNWARLRDIYLKDEVLNSKDIYADLPPDWNGFAPHRQWPIDRLIQVGGEILVPARPDEEDPASAEYGEEVYPGWRFQGKPATQYWRKPNPSDRLCARVNARKSYYGQPSTVIPHGVSFENFELEQPFSEGDEFWFGATTKMPDELIREWQ